MKRCALMQAPDTVEYVGQILIIDNNTDAGKRDVFRLTDKGYKCIGFLESNKPPGYLHAGFGADREKKMDAARRLLGQAQGTLI